MKIKQLGIFSGVALATLVTSGAAQAALVVVPPGLNPGQQFRLVFVTDGTRNATSTNINDYNAFVTNEALGSISLPTALSTALTTAGFNPGTITWNAIASTATVAARDNTGTNPSSGTGVPIYLIDGNRVANNNADLWDGSIQTQINRTASDQGGISSNVWTGSNTDGSIGTNLGGGFTGSGQTGNSAANDSTWIFSGFAGLGPDSLRLYGISSVLTVPTPAVTVPEPSSLLGLITLGGLMLGSAVGKARK
ncbi:MAG: PEP-CTERM sorting domain-containing protein [Microcystis aeruginosa Ma_MB_F_20061100_S20]|uniref:PEP-CTERM sorting domain-containing protein n=1 Tax=Microcystis aeruginosa Ma_MB_F_20061100_S20D TaxID=2486253 RepID=A0A552EFX4_MICAE|nr:MAG: PEP-CTERM sorting domain-containing protein [Microcystis aeruginosa Ma_MB_F_20061100_S20D]TRU38496.1 MAG: PEP-CTERM sorting domain-containing protein [Microcystis aeruginosa Ma_MB_F_20061100_S20]